MFGFSGNDLPFWVWTMRMRTGSRKQIWEMRNLHISEKKVDFFSFFVLRTHPWINAQGLLQAGLEDYLGWQLWNQGWLYARKAPNHWTFSLALFKIPLFFCSYRVSFLWPTTREVRWQESRAVWRRPSQLPGGKRTLRSVSNGMEWEGQATRTNLWPCLRCLSVF